MKQYFDEKVRIDSLRKDREALVEALGRFQSGSASIDAFLTIPAAQGATELNRSLEELSEAEANLRVMRQRFTDEYKPVRDLQERIATLREVTDPAPGDTARPARWRSWRRRAMAQVATSSKDLQSIPQRTIKEQRLPARDDRVRRTLPQPAAALRGGEARRGERAARREGARPGGAAVGVPTPTTACA